MKTSPAARWLAILGLCGVAAFAWHAPRLAAQTYDARRDFSLAANPNGVWSYGGLESVDDTFYFPLARPASDLDYPGQVLWYNGGTYPDSSAVQANTTSEPVTFGTVLIEPDQLNLDGEDAPAVVRWTAPADGVYDVTGLFQRNDDQTNAGPVGVTVSIVQDGLHLLFQQANFLTFRSQLPFTLSALPLAAGTTLDFVENSAVPHNDSVGLSATITNVGALTTPVIDVYATDPRAVIDGDTPGLFTLTRTGDTSAKLVVRYTVSGSGRAGVDYTALSGKAKFKPGQSTARVKVIPDQKIPSGTKKIVKIALRPGDGYALGNVTAAKVKIVPFFITAPGAVVRTPLD